MKIKLLNLFTLAFIPIVLLTFSTSALSFVWCFGDDGHTRLEQASVNGCIDCEEVISPHGGGEVDSLSYKFDEKARSCSDFQLDKDNLVISKRSFNAADIPTLGECRVSLNFSPNVYIDQVPPALQSQRVSQTILAHRTVVLLN
jgi:hypothetical protein